MIPMTQHSYLIHAKDMNSPTLFNEPEFEYHSLFDWVTCESMLSFVRVQGDFFTRFVLKVYVDESVRWNCRRCKKEEWMNGMLR